MENRIKAIIIDQFNLNEDDIDLELNFKDDLNADSLDLVELIMTFEDEFDLEIQDEDLSNIETISDIIERITEI